MGAHIVDGQFQSDKYPTTPAGKVPLSVKDPTAQDLLWEYAQRRRSVDSEFSDDLEVALKAAGFKPASPRKRDISYAEFERWTAGMDGVSYEAVCEHLRTMLDFFGITVAEPLKSGAE